MQNYIKIIVDSGCDISTDFANKNNITIVPLKIRFNDTDIIDDETLNIENLLYTMETSEDFGKTSCPSPQEYINAFENNDNIIVITLSSKISGSYNSANLAKQMYIEQYPNKKIHIVDSMSAASAEVLLVHYLLELQKTHNDFDEICDLMNKKASSSCTYFLLDNMDRLIKNGRIKGMKAVLVSKLNIKAIMTQKNGEICKADSARGSINSIRKMSKIIVDQCNQLKSSTIYITHINTLDRVNLLIENINSNDILENIKDVIINTSKGISTYYASLGGMIVSF